MKIGVLTYHRVINIGAILQAYCVCEFYKSMGHEVQLIDLRNKKTEWNETRKLFNIRKLKFNRHQFNNFRSVRNFLKGHFSLTRKIYDGNPHRFAKFLNKQNFDIVSVGSDTVWELRDPGYTRLTVNEFFLPGYSGKKISFAASMDPVNKNVKDYYELMKARAAALRNFNFINIRDKSTQEALTEYGLDSIFIPDPTIIMKDHEIFNINSVETKDEVGLQLDVRTCDYIRERQSDPVVNVYSYAPSFTHNHFPSNLSVEQYLQRLGCLRVLVTDRFHGTLLTLLVSNCEIPVIAFENPKKWQHNHSKIRDLFDAFGISEFVADNERQLADILDKTIRGDLDWPAEEVRNRMSVLSDASRQTLEQQLESLR